MGETEALGVEDHHHRGIGHIHAHLDDGGGDKNLGLTTDETLHLLFLLTGFHASVDLTEPELGEGLFQYLVAILQILQVALLRLFDEREDDIHLTTFPDLLTDAVVEGGHAGIENMGGPDGFATWWEFVDHTHVEVAIERHGEGTRDRGGGHHQYMGRVLTLAPEFGALGDTETVLFIDDHHTQTGKLHRVLDDGTIPVSRATRTGMSFRKPMMVCRCCSARISVGAMIQA